MFQETLFILMIILFVERLLKVAFTVSIEGAGKHSSEETPFFCFRLFVDDGLERIVTVGIDQIQIIDHYFKYNYYKDCHSFTWALLNSLFGH